MYKEAMQDQELLDLISEAMKPNDFGENTDPRQVNKNYAKDMNNALKSNPTPKTMAAGKVDKVKESEFKSYLKKYKLDVKKDFDTVGKVTAHRAGLYIINREDGAEFWMRPGARRK